MTGWVRDSFTCSYHLSRPTRSPDTNTTSGQPPFFNWPAAHFAEVVQGRKAAMDRLNNAYWLGHRLRQSKARVVYGSVYQIPEAIGPVDVAVYGSILPAVWSLMLALRSRGVGSAWTTLHLMFETQYTELAQAVDQIAERIRALGHPAPGSYKAFSRLSTIKEEESVPAAEEMIRQLVIGQEAVVRTAREVFPTVEKANDQPTADLLTQRMQIHEKNAWMLRSLLE